MFGFLKRIAKLEQMVVMQEVDLLSIRKRLSSIESYHIKTVLRDTNRQNKELFNGAIVAVESGTIEPVMTHGKIKVDYNARPPQMVLAQVEAKKKVKKPTVKKKLAKK